jgi:hypothetical protein
MMATTDDLPTDYQQIYNNQWQREGEIRLFSDYGLNAHRLWTGGKDVIVFVAHHDSLHQTAPIYLLRNVIPSGCLANGVHKNSFCRNKVG